MGAWLQDELSSVALYFFFVWMAMIPAWPGAIWSLIAGTTWVLRPSRRARVAERYPLAVVTWLTCTPLILELVFAGWLLAIRGWYEVLVPILIVSMVVAIVAAHRVRSRESPGAALTLFVLALGTFWAYNGLLFMAGSAVVAPGGSVTFLLFEASVYLVFFGGIANAGLAFAKTGPLRRMRRSDEDASAAASLPVPGSTVHPTSQ